MAVVSRVHAASCVRLFECPLPVAVAVCTLAGMPRAHCVLKSACCCCCCRAQPEEGKEGGSVGVVQWGEREELKDLYALFAAKVRGGGGGGGMGPVTTVWMDKLLPCTQE